MANGKPKSIMDLVLEEQHGGRSKKKSAATNFHSKEQIVINADEA